MACKGLPSMEGKKSWIRDAHGKPARWKVVGEIVWRQSTFPDKALCVHKLESPADSHKELRFGYYTCREGKWTWGRYAPMLPLKDVKTMEDEMRRRGWV